jgi:hypothetical protein
LPQALVLANGAFRSYRLFKKYAFCNGVLLKTTTHYEHQASRGVTGRLGGSN